MVFPIDICGNCNRDYVTAVINKRKLCSKCVEEWIEMHGSNFGIVSHKDVSLEQKVKRFHEEILSLLNKGQIEQARKRLKEWQIAQRSL